MKAAIVHRSDEGSLVAAAKSGDRDAMGDLFERHHPGVRRVLFSILGPDGAIDDLSQDIFIQAFRSLGSFRGEAGFSTWLHRIAVNGAMNLLRSRTRSRRLVSVPSGESSSSTGPDGDLDAKRMLRHLYAILDTLSVARRVAFSLFEIEGRTIEDVAAAAGISKMSAKSRIWFARAEVMRKAAADPVLVDLLAELKRS